jgi:hypothetical protein
MRYPGTEPVPPQWEASDQQPELCTAMRLVYTFEIRKFLSFINI